MSQRSVFSSQQLLFKEIIVGTLIYAVVLGFYDDYTNLFAARSFSIVFLCALVMQILTYLTFALKKYVVTRLKNKAGVRARVGMFFCVWLIMFVSKFVFLWVLDWLFGSYVTVGGFAGLVAIIVTVTVLSRLTDTVFVRLGDTTPPR